MTTATKHDEDKPEYGRLGFACIALMWEWDIGDDDVHDALECIAIWECEDHDPKYLRRAYRYMLSSISPADIYRAMKFGARKYAWDNWRGGTGLKYSRLLNAFARHILACVEDCSLDARDNESGLPHLHHAMCCLHFLVCHEAYGLGEDDWWRKETT